MSHHPLCALCLPVQFFSSPRMPEGTCSPHGDCVLIIIIFKTQNQEQDNNGQPKNHWIDLQVIERQHPHLCKNDRKKGQDS